MKYIASIQFKKDIVFESNREDHKKRFKIKTKRYKVDDRSKPIRDDNKPFHHRTRYAKKTVTEKSFIIFEKDFHLNFSDITVIVGDNGSGKSSLLKHLKFKQYVRPLFSEKTDDELKSEHSKKYFSNDDRELVFDSKPEYFIFENQIHKNSFIDSIGKGKTFVPAEDIVSRWYMSYDSNGESTIDFIERLQHLNNSLIVLDEPETSLSIRSQVRILKVLKNISKTNQLIIVTHSPILMKLSKTVYDFDKKRYVKTQDYIDDQMQLLK